MSETTTGQYKHIFNYACAILARRRYSVNGLREKMYKRYPGEHATIENVITRFVALEYLDDAEFARAFIGDQLKRKPQGLRLIRQKLLQKGIDSDLAGHVINTGGVDETELAKAAAVKKARTLKAASPLQKKQKLYRFLASRGFSADTIMKALYKEL